jgi:hypothetical protein
VREGRFLFLLDAYGADLSRWPRALQEQAGALRLRRPGLRAACDEAARLDELLRPQPGAVNLQRTLAAARQRIDGQAEPEAWVPAPALARVWCLRLLLPALALASFLAGLLVEPSLMPAPAAYEAALSLLADHPMSAEARR